MKKRLIWRITINQSPECKGLWVLSHGWILYINLLWMGPVCQLPMDGSCVSTSHGWVLCVNLSWVGSVCQLPMDGMSPVCQPLMYGSSVSTSHGWVLCVNLPWMGPVCQPPMDRSSVSTSHGCILCINLPWMYLVYQAPMDGSCVSASHGWVLCVNLPWIGPMCQPLTTYNSRHYSEDWKESCEILTSGHGCCTQQLTAAVVACRRLHKTKPVKIQQTCNPILQASSVWMELLVYRAAKGGQATLLWGHCRW